MGVSRSTCDSALPGLLTIPLLENEGELSTAQMEEICQQIDEKAHTQITVVTINTLGGSDVETHAVDLFKQWGIGNKSFPSVKIGSSP
jgi:TLP18.3/Psb32/MOLO-1 phosphatase superfamily protein